MCLSISKTTFLLISFFFFFLKDTERSFLYSCAGSPKGHRKSECLILRRGNISDFFSPSKLNFHFEKFFRWQQENIFTKNFPPHKLCKQFLLLTENFQWASVYFINFHKLKLNSTNKFWLINWRLDAEIWRKKKRLEQ